MISFDQVTLTYPEAARPALRDVSLDIPEGELVLVLGRTGAGKSTLLRAVNGLVPHFTGGEMSGRVTVAGRDTRHHRPRDFADVVGMVLQDPRDGFVADVVEDEIAYGMESLGLASDVMRRRVEESLDLLGLHDLRQRHVHTLSGGEQQRTAIASVLAAHPKVLVLDEPTSALDPAAAEEVLAALQRLVHDLGITVLMAEHRLERVVQFADRVIRVNDDGGVHTGDPVTMLSMSPVAPPVVELGRYARWSPLPLSVRDARRHSGPMRKQLAQLSQPKREQGKPGTRQPPFITIKKMTASYGPYRALHRIDITIGGGEIVAVMGRNGSGKSTLLRSIVGLNRPAAGQVRLCGHEPHRLAPRDLVRHVGMVPQEPSDLLWRDSVAAECRAADTDAGAESGTAFKLFLRLAPAVATSSHPRDLSEGQRLALALAVILAADPQVLLLDEPTRGLDYPTKARLGALLKARAAAGRAVVLATHDVELVAEVCNRTIVLAEAEVVADGPTFEVVLGSPQFAPQVAKVLAPLPWLTVAEVAATLPEAG